MKFTKLQVFTWIALIVAYKVLVHYGRIV